MMSDSLVRDILIAVHKARARMPNGPIPVHVSKTTLIQLCDAWGIPCAFKWLQDYEDLAEAEWDGATMFSVLGAAFIYVRALPDGEWRVDA